MANINFNQKFEDKSLKYASWIVILVILGIAITITVITTTKILSGEHVKAYGLEFNIPKEHPDTVIKTIMVAKDVPAIKAGLIPKTSVLTSRVGINKATKTAIIKDSLKPLAKYNITAPISQSAIGDGATVTNNNYEPKPRILSKEEAQTVFDAVIKLVANNKGWNTSTKIRYVVPIQNNEALKFADQIATFLYNNGFTNWELRYAIFTGVRSSNFEVAKDSENNADFIKIHIFSQ